LGGSYGAYEPEKSSEMIFWGVKDGWKSRIENLAADGIDILIVTDSRTKLIPLPSGTNIQVNQFDNLDHVASSENNNLDLNNSLSVNNLVLNFIRN
jgi:hypothetical protein